MPTKSSVTKIKQGKVNNEEKVTLDLKEPEFMKNDKDNKITGAQKGTLIHLCMQKLSEKIEYDEIKVKELINDLKLKGLITDKEAKAINKNAILKFTKSRIWKRLKKAKEIYREKPFYYNVSASEFYTEKINEKILVQGIIDLFFIDENNKLVLIDYKTDFVEDEQELMNKYKEQLKLYKMALEKALKRTVDEIYIYSTYLSKEIKW